MSGFVVQGPKSDYRDSSGLKNGLYPLIFLPKLVIKASSTIYASHIMGFSLFAHVIKHKRANNNHSDICILKAQKNHYMLPNDLYLHLKLISFQADGLVSEQ